MYQQFLSDYASLPLQQRKLKFLEDTRAFYEQNPNKLRARIERGEDGPLCSYAPVKSLCEENTGCAIGRHLPEEIQNKLAEENNGIPNMSAEQLESLPEWMKEMGPDFLSEIQRFHDDGNDSRWDENGLTEYGVAEFEGIKEEFCQ